MGWAPDVLRDAGEDDGDVYVVGVRESTDPGSWSLLFMECLDADDEQDIELGMDTYCLVVDPGQATHYGGVRECGITGGELRLVFAEDAAATLGLPVEKRFVLDLPAQQLELLGRGLSRVLTSGRRDAVPHRLEV
ncbi:Imm10 family immunity protein [Phytohabitans kaempferiae]|uniref:Imm10 family immunity protein n=1 Tax=Phytohabitans kaempferiae TaxID=1620943 RepID=A0ABV6LXW0_9ACTN